MSIYHINNCAVGNVNNNINHHIIIVLILNTAIFFNTTSSSFILPPFCVVPQDSVLGPALFTNYVSPIASIVSSHGVNQQQYADDTQLFVVLSPSSLSSSLCSPQRCLFSSQLVHSEWSSSKSN